MVCARRERLVMRDAAQFDVIFRRNDDLGMRVELVVAAAELRRASEKIAS